VESVVRQAIHSLTRFDADGVVDGDAESADARCDSRGGLVRTVDCISTRICAADQVVRQQSRHQASHFNVFHHVGRNAPPMLQGHMALELLALRRGAEVEREWLAGLLWPEQADRQALCNSLAELRRALGTEAARLRSPTFHTLALDLSGAFVDVHAFDAAIARADAVSLEEAVALYRGPLLEGCMEEWVFPVREARDQVYLVALEKLAAAALAGLLLTGMAAQAQESFAQVVAEVNKKVVKLYGSGGFQGLADYGTGVIISPEGHILTVASHMLATQDLRVHLAAGRVGRRDCALVGHRNVPAHQERPIRHVEQAPSRPQDAVPYTLLTLPTIYPV